MFAASISVGVGMTLWCGLAGLRTRQGRAAPGGGQALMRSRPAGQMGPGTAGESFAGQQGCGSRLSGQAAPGSVCQPAAARRLGVDLAGDVTLEAADDLRLGFS